MSTHGVIAETHGSGWRGRYHHFDGYPEGLGKTLFGLYNKHFKKDLSAMLQVLIHDHPAGWSSINNNWDLPLNYERPQGVYESMAAGPECFCHGPHQEAGTDFYTAEDKGSWEWGYVFDVEKRTMTILYGDELLTTVNLDGKEPNWKKIQDKAYGD